MNSRFFEIGSIIAFCALLVLGFYVTYYFLDVLLIAIIFAYLVRPAKEKIPFKNETLSTLLAQVIVLVPIFVFMVFTFLSLVNALVADQALKELLLGIKSIEDTIADFIMNSLQFLGIKETEIAQESLRILTDRVETFTQNITTMVVDWAFRLPNLAARVILAAFLSFYLVRDGKQVKTAILKIAPESSKKKVEKLINAYDAVFYGIVIGYLFKAIFTGFIGVIVFYFLGIGNPVVMGVIVGAFDFIPLIGPWTVFVGLFLWYALQGDIGFAIKMVVVCYPTISLIPELYIRPKISGAISQVHPMVMLIGILGGIMSLGAIGILAGPLILGAIVVTVKSYFLDIHIEKEDIIDKFLGSIKSKISAARGKLKNTQDTNTPAEPGEDPHE
jgi:predicted PurR-regulated permease PerM